MKKLNNKLILCLCAVLLLTCCMSVTNTQARYQNSVTWQGVYELSIAYVTSDRLSAEGQTVLLEDWLLDGEETYREISIGFFSYNDTVSGTLSCETDDAYITATLGADKLAVSEEGQYVTMFLQLKDAAMALQKETTVTIQVSWVEIDNQEDQEDQEDQKLALYGEFVVTLVPESQDEDSANVISTDSFVPGDDETTPEETTETTDPEEVTDPEESTEGTDPEESTEATDPEKSTEATDPEETTEGTDPEETTEGTDPEETTEGTEPEESTEATDPEESTEGTDPEESTEATDPEESTEATDPEESTEATDPEETTEATDPEETTEATDPEESTEETETPDPTEETTAGIVSGATVDENNNYEECPALTETTLEETESADEPVEISTYWDCFNWSEWFGIKVFVPQSAKQLELFCDGEGFPAGTRYMTQDGTDLLLGDPQTIVIPVEEQAELLILLNLENWEDSRKESGDVILTVLACDSAGALMSTDSITLSSTLAALELQTDGIFPVIAGEGALEIPCQWDDTDVTWKLEHLTKSEEEGISWTEEESNWGLTIQLPQKAQEDQEEDSEMTLLISNSEALAPPGSYRLTLQREADGTVFATVSFLFFIHY